MTLLAIFLTLLQLFDGWTTYRILKLGGYEQNALLRKVIERIGAYPALAGAKAIAIVLIWVLAWFKADIALVALAVAYIWIAANNWRVLVRLRTRLEGK